MFQSAAHLMRTPALVSSSVSDRLTGGRGSGRGREGKGHTHTHSDTHTLTHTHTHTHFSNAVDFPTIASKTKHGRDGGLLGKGVGGILKHNKTNP